MRRIAHTRIFAVKSPVVFFSGVILTALCLAVMWVEPLFLKKLQFGISDMLMRQFSLPSRSGKVAIIDIDESSLEEMGQWPWPRHMIGDMVDKLESLGAKVIVFDMVFAEPDRTSPERIVSDMKERLDLDARFEGVPEDLQNFDEVLARKLEGAPVVLGMFMHQAEPVRTGGGEVDPHFRNRVVVRGELEDSALAEFLYPSRDVLVNLPLLVENAAGQAFFNTDRDSDNVIRRNPMVWMFGADRMYPSLSLEALRIYKGASNIFLDCNENGVVDIRIADLTIPSDFNGLYTVRYRQTVGHRDGADLVFSNNFRAADLLNGGIARERIEGRIVFIGTSAVGLEDRRATPIQKEGVGVEIHGTIVDNILAGDSIIESDLWVARFFAVLFIGLFLSYLISSHQAVLSFLITLAVGLSFFWLSWYLFDRHNMLFQSSWIIVSVGLIYTSLTTFRYWLRERELKWLRENMGHMVSDEVLTYLEENPGMVQREGVEVNVTVFFSDLIGFTSASEQMTPEVLARFMSEYLTPMDEIIRMRKGFVDKYIGDMIMAVWGAPYPMPDHAVQACMTALEQRRKLPELQSKMKARYGVEIDFRVGINTGLVTAGMIGSDERREYTVLGDTVNEGARLEPSNKEYGTSIIIGEKTYAAAQEHIEVRLLDQKILKGKSKSIRLYELIGAKGEISEQMMSVRSHYEDGLKFVCEQEWGQALTCFESALGVIADDGPSKRYVEICQKHLEK